MAEHNIDNQKTSSPLTGLEIAVIGLSGRFPGANTVYEFWENLKNGLESISFFTREELEADGINQSLLDEPGFINAKGIIDEPEYFDSAFFGYTPVEAELMDPQMRIFYECVWWALENAGYSPDNYEGKITIIGGATNNRNWEGRALFSGKTSIMGSFASDHLMDRDFLCTRMAYRLNFTGPAITMKTACSSALVAVDLACRLLLTGQCDIALGGGVSIVVPIKAGYLYEEGMIRSNDGHVRAFDKRSKGVVFSDGVGVVVLKRLEEAIEDRDNILAVIKGSAINNDGSSKGSYSAPGIDGQAEVIRAAHIISEVDPETIDYVETHGTGTVIGDPIEIEGLTLAFDTDKRNYCALGSVKTNVGHLDTAAGIAALIKTVLSIHYKYIPPSLHFENANPKIDFANTPFYVNTQLQEWKRNGHPRRAGVSSFGVGGTNAHLILEEVPEREASSSSRKNQLILLSAKNSKALGQLSLSLSNHLQANPDLNLADVAYTLQVGRSAFKMREMLLVSSIDDVIANLSHGTDEDKSNSGKVFHAVAQEETRAVFMFSGQGSQYINMGRDLYTEEPDFAIEMDNCFEIFKNVMGYDLKEILYPSLASNKSNISDNEQKERINHTEIAQPVIFVLEYSLAKLLMKWGVIPHAMIGHSIGEYVAACLSGVFSLEDAIKVVAMRGKLMQQMEPGSMLSVSLPESDVKPLLGKELELGAVNTPNLCVVSGPDQAIKLLAEQLTEKELQVRILHTSHAFHSRSMEPMLKQFENEMTSITFNPPQIPYISNLTGNWIKPEEASDPNYWAQHLRRTVRFTDGLSELLKDEYAELIEVGPGRALSTFVRQHPGKKSGQLVQNMIRHPNENISDTYYLIDKLGRLWLNGQSVNWDAFYHEEKRNRLPLPLYPFQRQFFWISRDALLNIGADSKQEELERKKDFEKWFYTSSWKRSTVFLSEAQEKKTSINWLLFIDECGIGTHLAERLQKDDNHVIQVKMGSNFTYSQEKGYIINPSRTEDYIALFDKLQETGLLPQRVVHLWNITGAYNIQWGIDWDEKYLNLGFYSLLYLIQALGKQSITEKVRISVMADGVHMVLGNENIYPEKAVIMGPVNIVSQEFSNIFCSLIDINVPEPGSSEENKLLERLQEEVSSNNRDTAVAYRNNFRMVQTYEQVTLSNPDMTVPRLREQGVYLITGGLGGIGLVLARYLASQFNARLILTGRYPLPPREEWDKWLSSYPITHKVCKKIRQIKELEEFGGRVMEFSVDVTDFQGMEKVISQARKEFGQINGVIHAAGLPGGGVIQLKTREIAEGVLLPKVRGTLILDTLLKNNPLDFILLCSSINSVVPMLGQVDYFGANAFLDAYAFYKTYTDNVFTVSVNWDSWREVGMAVEAAKVSPTSVTEQEPTPLIPAHPLLVEFTVEQEGHKKYIGHLTLEKDWPLNEHMTNEGKGLLPGTTYLELARAGWENYSGDIPLVITNTKFSTPMIVNPGDRRDVYLHLERQGNGCKFFVESAFINESGEQQFLQKHVTGEIRTLNKVEPKIHDVEKLKARCNLVEFYRDAEMPIEIYNINKKNKDSGGLLVFGHRWKTTLWSKFGKNEGIAMFELAEKFVEELAQYKLHPALLDTSTGFLFAYVSSGNAYIPFSYKNLIMYRPLPHRLISYCRVIDSQSNTSEFLKFHIIIMDEEGRECVVVEEFTMLEVSEEIIGRIQQKEQIVSQGDKKIESQSTLNEELNPRQRYLRRIGIKPQEGVDAFRYILGNQLPQVVVSTTNLPLRIEAQNETTDDSAGQEEQQDKSADSLHSRPEISTTYVAPESDIEKMIAEIWEAQLGISGVGLHDDFFELGGDSLKAITVNGKIHRKADIEVPLGEFFNNPTIRGLSEYILTHSESESFQAITPAEKKEFYALSPAQERLFMLYQLEPQSTVYNLSWGMEIGKNIDIGKIESVFLELVKRHESLRTSFIIVDGQPVQRVLDDTNFELEHYELKKTNTVELEDKIAEFVKPFDLSRAPLIRAAVLEVKEKKSLLLVDFHHIISDARSLIFLFPKDFSDLNIGKQLPPLLLQYKDFSVWQNQRKHSGGLKKYESFWLEEFKNGVPELILPYDFERKSDNDFAGEWVIFHLEPDEINAFRTMLKEEEVTLFMGLLAVFNVLLYKLSGQEDIVVGTPVAGRNHPDLQPIIGMFVNMMVLRNYPLGERTFRKFLYDIKTRTIKAFENQEYQFENLVEKLAPQRKSGRNPLFDVHISLQNVAENKTPLTGSAKNQDILDIETRASKFDLSLEIIELGETLRCKFEYKTSLFLRETIERFAGYFREILTSVTKDNNICLKDIVIVHDFLEPETEAPQMEFKF